MSNLFKQEKQKRYTITIEAPLGAIYKDSNGHLELVARAIRQLEIDAASHEVAYHSRVMLEADL